MYQYSSVNKGAWEPLCLLQMRNNVSGKSYAVEPRRRRADGESDYPGHTQEGTAGPAKRKRHRVQVCVDLMSAPPQTRQPRSEPQLTLVSFVDWRFRCRCRYPGGGP